MRKIIIALAIALSGCATSSGVKIDQDQLGGIKVGVTTEAEVRQKLGAPTSILSMPDGKVLIYSHASSQIKGASFIPIIGAFAGGAEINVSSASIGLNLDGIVKYITSSDMKSETK